MKPIPHHIPAYAIKCHTETNHFYDKVHPYVLHLSLAVAWGYHFIHLIPEEEQEAVISAIWLHDAIEDVRQTRNDIKEVAGERVADLVYAVTNEKGKNRKERANDKYYIGIAQTPYAGFVKLADRLANVQYSWETKSSMFGLYKKEEFPLSLTDKEEEQYGYAMRAELNGLLAQEIETKPMIHQPR